MKWQQETVDQWYADGGDDKFRLDYDLRDDDLIVEVGACDGFFTEKMARWFNCRILALEPSPVLFQEAEKRLHQYPQVTLSGLGLSDRTRYVGFDLDGPATRTRDVGSGTALLVDAAAYLLALPPIALFVLNVEGAEYEILPHMIRFGVHKRIENLQIQFHDYHSGADQMMESIQNSLSVTHHTTYQYPFVFENWRRNDEQ